MKPDAEWLPMAFLLPRWFVDFCEALIEKACGDDEDENGCPGRPHHGVDCPGDACRFAGGVA